jgi:uncharacterized cupin superfamily protein
MKCVTNIFDTEKLNFKIWQHGEHYAGRSAELAENWKAEELGFHVEILEAKKFSCPYHQHEKEEELFLALEGSATVRQDGEFFTVKKGDLFFYKKMTTHQLYNHTEHPFVFFALSSMNYDEICRYPDSKKVFDARAKKITQGELEVGYWKDEEDPRKFWPKERL